MIRRPKTRPCGIWQSLSQQAQVLQLCTRSLRTFPNASQSGRTGCTLRQIGLQAWGLNQVQGFTQLIPCREVNVLVPSQLPDLLLPALSPSPPFCFPPVPRCGGSRNVHIHPHGQGIPRPTVILPEPLLPLVIFFKHVRPTHEGPASNC